MLFKFNTSHWVLLIFSMMLCSKQTHAQRIELYAGSGQNSFLHPYYPSPQKSEFGPSLCGGLSIDSLVSGIHKTRLALQFEHYGGNVYAKDGGISYGNYLDLHLRKTVVTLSYYPLNFYLKKKIDLNLGVYCSKLVWERYTGTHWGWAYLKDDHHENIAEEYSRLSNRYNVGINTRIAWNTILPNNLTLSVAYLYQLGLSPETKVIPFYFRARKHWLNIGIKKTLKDIDLKMVKKRG